LGSRANVRSSKSLGLRSADRGQGGHRFIEGAQAAASSRTRAPAVALDGVTEHILARLVTSHRYQHRSN
jgi:hypothetical protein